MRWLKQLLMALLGVTVALAAIGLFLPAGVQVLDVPLVVEATGVQVLDAPLVVEAVGVHVLNFRLALCVHVCQVRFLFRNHFMQLFRGSLLLT